MISSIYVPICNRFYARRANNGIMIYCQGQGYLSYTSSIEGHFLKLTAAQNFVTEHKSLFGSS